MKNAVLAAAFAVVPALAGCGGSGTTVAGGEGATAATVAEAHGAFPGAPATGAEKKTFNPFSPNVEAAAEGAREVIASPTVAEVMQTGTLPEMSLGRADAPVTIIKYASLTCPYCKRFHAEVFPQLKREYIDTGKVRFIIREFPIGQSSGNATIAWRCAGPAKFFDLYGKFLAQQAHWVSQEMRLDAIYAVAAQVGLKRAEFDACLKDEALIKGLKWVKERGRTLGVIGTPNFFIQGKLVKKVLTMDELRAIIDPLLAGKVAEKG